MSNILKKIRLPAITERNFKYYFVVFCIAFFSLCLHIVNITERPQDDQLTQLYKQRLELKKKMGEEVLKYLLISKELTNELKKADKDGKFLRKESKEVWDSIPGGSVIGEKKDGTFHPLGKNKEVSKLNSQASKKEDYYKENILDLGIKYGPILKEKYSSTYWDEYQQTQASIEKIKKDHAWYYENNWRGSLFRFIHGLASILGLLSGPITLLMIIGVFFSLFAE